VKRPTTSADAIPTDSKTKRKTAAKNFFDIKTSPEILFFNYNIIKLKKILERQLRAAILDIALTTRNSERKNSGFIL